jgi:putative ABC transport system substrate-binding protein
MTIRIGRRELITAVGGAALAWPHGMRAQQPAMPVIGYLNSRALGDTPGLLAAFRQGLKDAGFVEGQNVAIEYRFAENRNERLPTLAADLTRHQVAVIAAATTPAALAAKAATTTIPIVIATAGDPVQLGLVGSLNRPGGNVTGVSMLAVEVAPKRLELLHELLPSANVIALLVNPSNPSIAEGNTRLVLSAAGRLGIKLAVMNANTEADFDGVFAMLIERRAAGLVIGGDPFFTGSQERLAVLSVRTLYRRSMKIASSSPQAV